MSDNVLEIRELSKDYGAVSYTHLDVYKRQLEDYAKECRPLLNQGEPLPEMPQLSDFDPSIEAYREQVMAEIEQEAADAGMTVEEYAAAGYEAPAAPEPEPAPEQPQEAPEPPTKEPAASNYYYSINEGAARRAKEMNSYSGRQDFGDRDGSLIEHIRGYQEFYLHDEQWKNHVLKYQGPKALAEDQASREAFVSEIIPYMELHCNLSRLEQEAQRLLTSGDTLTPEETAYYSAVADYAKECRPLLNQGEPLPEMPQLSDFDPSIQAYREQVMAEIEQEAADAGMTVEEYAAAGYAAPAAPEPEPAPEKPQEAQEQPQREAPEPPTKEPAASDYYYSINEGAARRAKEMNSFSDYKPGSATAEYRHYVDNAFEIAQAQKKRVDPMYHEKIDSLLDTYARKLAANMNHSFAIDARVPSILIAGGSNFPVRQKEKQNAARDSNMQEWQYIQGLLAKIRSTGMGGIRQDLYLIHI